MLYYYDIFYILELHRSSFRFTPMMSILIGIVLALVIVALVVIIVLRLLCCGTEDLDNKSRQKVTSSGATAGIDRRGSGSIIALSDKGGEFSLHY